MACLVTPTIWYNWSTLQILGVFCLPSGSLSVYRKPDCFYASIKTIPDSASVHTYERWFRRDFCNGAKLHRADLLKWRVTYQIGVHTIPENFLSAQKAICLVWSKTKFLSLFVGPFPADRPRIPNSAKKIKNFSTEDKKILGKSRAIFRTCMYNQTRCVYSEMSSYLGEH